MPIFAHSAQDLECGATKVDVDAYEFDEGKMCITVQDDGVGMDRARLHCMLSFGFSNKAGPGFNRQPQTCQGALTDYIRRRSVKACS